jgi:hypothetical protein
LFKGQDDFEVVVELDAFAADDVRERRLHFSQELAEMPGGMLRVTEKIGSYLLLNCWLSAVRSSATGRLPSWLRPKRNQRLQQNKDATMAEGGRNEIVAGNTVNTVVATRKSFPF